MASEIRELHGLYYEPDRWPCCPTANEALAQPIIWTRDWFNTGINGHCVDSFGTNDEVAKLPPFSTFSNKQTQTDSSGSSFPTAGPELGVMARSAYGAQMASNQVTQRTTVLQTGASGQLLHPHPVPATSSELISFTIPPTEKDLSQMQPVHDKNGRIKRPLNAFMVWSRIHRQALRKARPHTRTTDASILLGSEWSKLTDEQKQPYYKVAYKLKKMHEQQFPDYEFRPQKKKDRECLSVEQGAGQDQDPIVYSSGQDQDPIVYSSGQDQDPIVYSSGQDQDPIVYSSGQDQDPIVYSSGQDQDPIVYSSGQDQEHIVHSSGQDQDPIVSSSDFHTIPPVPCMSQAPTIYSCPSVISYMVGYYPYTFFGPYHATSFYPSIQSTMSSSPTVEVRNYMNTHLQRDETAPITEHHTSWCQS